MDGLLTRNRRNLFSYNGWRLWDLRRQRTGSVAGLAHWVEHKFIIFVSLACFM